MTVSETTALFSDGKAPDAFRTIGEVAAALGIRQHVLRYWEEQMPMLRPIKRSGGRRYYRPEDVALVQQIDRLVHREGYTLRGARQALEAGVQPGAHTLAAAAVTVLAEDAPPPAQSGNPALLAELKALRSGLAAALAAAS